MGSVSYYSLNQYLHDTFHTKVYKLPINAGFTCPNRDGTLDTRGCIFCSGEGSGDFCLPASFSVTNQIEESKKKVAGKIGKDGKYIAYFQAYTNTYAPVERLRSVYEEAINHPDIVAISVATRPDCLPKDVLDLLSELNAIKPVWVELGLQTIHEDTAKYIRRGYSLNAYDISVKELKKRGLYTIVHVILGLPGETKEDMLATVDYVVKSGIDGIKLQLLHVLKNTDLATDYNEGRFSCMSLEEYADLIADCIQIIPKNIAIHRLTGDGAKKDLIAPLWSGDKKRVLNTINAKLRDI